MKIGTKVIITHPEPKYSDLEGTLFLEMPDKVVVKVEEDRLLVFRPEQIKEKKIKTKNSPVSRNLRRTLDKYTERVTNEKISVERFMNELFKKR